uniref:Uncharacterized protein n=2 Tax=Corethron hystrix TaxID=216773 RepID=A0A6U5LJW9_9STRA|mmetsp:Transcript_5824/g.12328  ORF Transcript_5824/g.12328 Transcript_5824/m.12328 type:complete len:641 (+) Transcript_5824:167-2089(+)|eukprot:CAMPEP_0113309772 /NCGR_PEP_ID=MMETSP0010_2-20120614/7680_1 /TAXON_ID=216773 ORGANISM="Corethron hystrix, Strain 308" /NCGR_SAMPLE_ID=MMETSP0010_2 /ASSEMBLY_ACC=CAM_ASM_000155 /LENGTH=640 /DNA_ID=CAMNT_0000165087 /DNA_START=104 /DNA_END=2026 /DNA_ORIENTATION=+ /assembly_acc=CAM_ASM_000155
MVYFASLIVTALVGQAQAYTSIAGYYPGSDVTDHLNLDLDQKDLETNLSLLTEGCLTRGKDIYENGGHSMSIAYLKLDSDFDVNSIASGTLFTGSTNAGQIVLARKYDGNLEAGILKLQYEVSGQSPCYVGGLNVKDFSGCFVAVGTVTDGTNTLSYTYDMTTKNMNGRTLSGLSSVLNVDMANEANFKIFETYYGRADYSYHWVTSAFEGTSTNFTRGNADFTNYSLIGKTEAIKKGSVHMGVGHYALHEFENALKLCELDVDSRELSRARWDEGVALYTGSMEGTEGTDRQGKFPYTLAEKRCENFKTCGDGADSSDDNVKSWVNINLMAQFRRGKSALFQKDCDGAQAALDNISSLIYIPLIQSTLRYAYMAQLLQGDNSDQNEQDKVKAEGAVFAAAVLPKVYAIDPDAAEIIYANMKTGATETVFSEVKDAFESVYHGFRINCNQIGGLIEASSDTPYDGAERCRANTGLTNESKEEFKIEGFKKKMTCSELANISLQYRNVICVTPGVAETCELICRENTCFTNESKEEFKVEGFKKTMTCNELANISLHYRNMICATPGVAETCRGTCLGTCGCYDDPNQEYLNKQETEIVGTCEDLFTDFKYAEKCNKIENLLFFCPDVCDGWCDHIPFGKK